MKTIALFLVFVFCLALTACSGPVKELDDYINFRDDLYLEMCKKVEANPTKAGVDEARKIFDSKKDELKAKRVALRDKKLNSDQTARLINSSTTTESMYNVTKSKIKDIDASLEFTKLMNDFDNWLK